MSPEMPVPRAAAGAAGAGAPALAGGCMPVGDMPGAMPGATCMPPPPTEGDGGAPTPAGPVGCGGGGAETEAGAPSEGGASCRKGHPPPVTSGGIVGIGSGAPAPKVLAARPARPLASDTRSCERISGASATMGEHWQARGVKGVPAARAIQRVGAERGCCRISGDGPKKHWRPSHSPQAPRRTGELACAFDLSSRAPTVLTRRSLLNARSSSVFAWWFRSSTSACGTVPAA